jgi:hypothetical protein
MNQIFCFCLPARQTKEKPKQRFVPVLVDVIHAGEIALRNRHHPLVIGALTGGFHPSFRRTAFLEKGYKLFSGKR